MKLQLQCKGPRDTEWHCLCSRTCTEKDAHQVERQLESAQAGWNDYFDSHEFRIVKLNGKG